MRSIRRRIAPITALAIKEIREVLRQPRLIMVLVLGPFIILALFGIGYQASPPPLRTVLVVPEGGEFAARVGEIEEAMAPEIEVVDVTPDFEAARQQLRDRRIDLVVAAPEDAVESIRRGEHAEVRVLHDTLDPFEAAYIVIFSRASIDELNRAVLEEVASTAQERVDDYDDALPGAREAADRLSEALRSGETTEARIALNDIDQSLDRTRLESDEGFLSDVEAHITGEPAGAGPVSDARLELEAIDVEDPGAIERVDQLRTTLDDVEAAASEAQRLSPSVLVRPFVAETEQVVGADIPMTAFYVPGVLAVLLQHVMLTFAALSLVREEALGTIELFRMGPRGVLTILSGKYLGYAVIGTVTAAALVAGVVFGMGTPMNGDWAWLAAVLGLTLLASLGLGFAIATISNTDSQAVQYAMMSLLFTIFFSGFVVTLSRLAGITKVAAFAAPATSAIGALQDILFRGEAPRPFLLGGLITYSLAGFALGWWGLRRKLAT